MRTTTLAPEGDIRTAITLDRAGERHLSSICLFVSPLQVNSSHQADSAHGRPQGWGQGLWPLGVYQDDNASGQGWGEAVLLSHVWLAVHAMQCL